MLVGVDFDNTIVCYDRLFHTLAVERRLISPELPTNKTAVRDYLRSKGREDFWTTLQGIAYGPEIMRAEPFAGVLEFFRQCKQRGIPTAIISHKTKHPYRGENHDLHAAARRFLRHHGFFDEASTGLSNANVYLELTKEAKLARIAAADCTHFIDDLPEFLGETTFPSGVERILFDPDQRFAADARWHSIATWNNAIALLGASQPETGAKTTSMFGPPRPETGTKTTTQFGPPHSGTERGAGDEGSAVDPTNDEPPLSSVAYLLSSANLPATDFTLLPTSGGGNNRGYRVTTSAGASYFLKWYFRHPDDPRDRLGTEFAFTQFCRRHGLEEVPQPYGRDEAAGLALYEFVDGRRLTTAEIDEAAVDAATRFFEHLNEYRNRADAKKLPLASEACFSVQEHLDRIGVRVERLVAAADAPTVDGTAAEPGFQAFVRVKLAVGWEAIRRSVENFHDVNHLSIAEPLPHDERRLSPSDFGFQNILKTGDGRLRFLDFEYAGWDDPAKTACDFFCQVQVPVPMNFFDRFCRAIGGHGADADKFVLRCRRLLPAYRMKWCCIVLNVFLPEGSARRAFGTAQPTTSAQQSERLQKAIDLFDRAVLDRASLDVGPA